MNNLYIENLYVSYGNNNILNDFTLNLKHGELSVLLGPSGCGKSTLLSAISGLKKPDTGKIIFENSCIFDNLKNIDIPVEKRNIGFVFQSYALWPHMSIFENIAYPLKVRKFTKSEIDQKVCEVLKVVNMSGYNSRYPDELSGGEKQRIALARSLAYNPDILLLDEPLANLDANLKTSLIHEIKRIQRDLKVTMIYVTHDQSEAFEIADNIVIIKDGKIMQQGSPKDIYCNCNNLFVAKFIGKNNIMRREKFKNCRLKKECKKDSQKNLIAIRPEDISISESGKYEGKLESILYKGDRTEYRIRYEDSIILAFSDYDESLKENQKISFDIMKYTSM